MRHLCLSLVCFFVAALAGLDRLRSSRAADSPSSPTPNAEARRGFQDRKFGLFIHWGVYSLLGKGESVMDREMLPIAEYEKLPPRFNPTEFDAESWVKTAKASGMRYITVSAKHHDGFCMFDSKLTSYDVIDATPFGKDPLRSLADACRKHKIPLFFYYSLLDWHHPDYFPLGRTGKHAGRVEKGDWNKYVAYYQGQVRELCSQYGEIGGIRFDGFQDRPDASWDLETTYKIIHELQPKALVGNNHYLAPLAGEDFQIFEKALSGADSSGLNKVPPHPTMPLEIFETMNRSWGHNASDHHYKSAPEVIRLLADAAGRNANLLLNVGPKHDGAIPNEATERLAEVGRWLETKGDAIYGTRGGPIAPQAWGVSTIKADGKPISTVYLHVLDVQAPVLVPKSMLAYPLRILGNPQNLPAMIMSGGQALVTIPEADRSPIDTVINLTTSVFEPDLPIRRRENR